MVFTLPRQLAPLALQNTKVIYGLLLRASAETLLEVAKHRVARAEADHDVFSGEIQWSLRDREARLIEGSV